MTSPLGFNVALVKLHDYPRFLDRMRKLQPSAITACIDSDNDIDKVLKLRGDLPDVKIVGRVVHPVDGAFHLKPKAIGDNRQYVASPADVLNRWGALGKNGGILYLANEPGTDNKDDVARLVMWMVECIQLATGSGISLCIGNFSTGTPGMNDGEWDSRFDPVLKALSGSDMHYLGVHEYRPNPGRILRFVGAIERAKTLGIKPPRFLITEAGWDRDVNSTEPSNLRGYKSRAISGDAFAQQYINLCERDYRPYIDAGILLAVCIFCYGNTGGWEDFDVEEDTGFWDRLAKWNYRPALPPPVTATPAPTFISPPAMPHKYARIVNLLRELANEFDELD